MKERVLLKRARKASKTVIWVWYSRDERVFRRGDRRFSDGSWVVG